MAEVTFETSGYGDDALMEMNLGKQILDVLEKYYPLHPWFVNVSKEAGTATVQLMYEGVDQFGHIEPE